MRTVRTVGHGRVSFSVAKDTLAEQLLEQTAEEESEDTFGSSMQFFFR